MRATGPSSRRHVAAWLRAGVLLSFVAGLLFTAPGGASAAGNTITQPDNGGRYTSLRLDGSGFPVVSHYDPALQDLKVLHCGDATCSGGNTIATPDPTTMTPVGHTSLALAGDTPVVTHYDSGPRDLKLVHCGNATCSAPTVRTLDSGPTDNVGIYASVALNGGGSPVVAYYTEPFDLLKLLVCSNATCSTYNDQTVDATPITGLYNSIALDASGFPVISYYDQSNSNLRVVHCGSADCSSGNMFATPDGALGDEGKYTSLALDALGFPVVSYYNDTNDDLKVLHCGNATCTTANTITTPDSSGDVGQYNSLALDGAGNPVVSYYSVTATALKVLHCGNATCSAGNTITTPDSAGTVGQYTSLALDGGGNPVVSYYDATNGKLSVLHCGDPNCSPPPTPTPTPTSSPTPAPVGGFTQLPDVAVTGGSVLPAALLILLTLAVGVSLAVAAWTLHRHNAAG